MLNTTYETANKMSNAQVKKTFNFAKHIFKGVKRIIELTYILLIQISRLSTHKSCMNDFII